MIRILPALPLRRSKVSFRRSLTCTGDGISSQAGKTAAKQAVTFSISETGDRGRSEAA
jgi:hypothetical protein